MPWVTITLSLLGILVAVFLWQAKRWSDAKPSLEFGIAGGQTAQSQLFGIKIKNTGSIPVHKPAIFVSWQRGNLWEISRLTINANQYVPIQLSPEVQKVKVNNPTIWIDYYDEFGRLYRVQKHLVQRWDAGHSKFFLDEQPGSRKIKRPRWLMDLFRWQKVHP